MRAELISSKKMELGWERVQVSRFWSAPEEVPSQPAAGTKSKVAGNSLYFFFAPGHFFWLHVTVSTSNPFALSGLSYNVLSSLNQ